ncbi:MAG: VOC family protein [Alphaproteobacteria bacterium]|nr:VOC family protein [Alphaproteobacteria bacterium]
MAEHLHHVHVFAQDLERTVNWWQRMLGARVFFDGQFGGARNVFLKVGTGRLHLYDQPARDSGRGPVHHVGIRTDDLAGLVARMQAQGQAFRSPIREFGSWRYIMCEAPDQVLLELFEIESSRMPAGAAAFFADETDGPRQPTA